MSRTYAEQLRDGIGGNARPVGSDVLRGAADALDHQAAEIDRLRAELDRRALQGKE